MDLNNCLRPLASDMHRCYVDETSSGGPAPLAAVQQTTTTTTTTTHELLTTSTTTTTATTTTTTICIVLGGRVHPLSAVRCGKKRKQLSESRAC